MKSLIHKLLFAASFVLLIACAGQGGAGPDGGGPSGPVGGGQGQPTIAPGADHQPGIPVEDESYKDTLAPAPNPTDDPDDDGPNHWGPQKFQAP